MVTSLFRHERIQTTRAKARAVRSTAEKMITRAKVDTVHNRRTVGRDIKDKAVLAKLFVEIGPRFKERPGGYTRMLRIGERAGDASEMVLLELVDASTPSKAQTAPAESKSAKSGQASRKKETTKPRKPPKPRGGAAAAPDDNPADA